MSNRTYHTLERDDGSTCVYYTLDNDPAHYVVYDTLDERPGLAAENERLRARVAELYAALKPFAEAADAWDRERPQRINITLSDLAEVRAAIAKAEGGEGC